MISPNVQMLFLISNWNSIIITLYNKLNDMAIQLISIAFTRMLKVHDPVITPLPGPQPLCFDCFLLPLSKKWKIGNKTSHIIFSLTMVQISQLTWCVSFSFNWWKRESMVPRRMVGQSLTAVPKPKSAVFNRLIFTFYIITYMFQIIKLKETFELEFLTLDTNFILSCIILYSFLQCILWYLHTFDVFCFIYYSLFSKVNLKWDYS